MTADDPGPSTRVRRRVEVRGIVQGVGFRPFVYARARHLALTGSVRNSADGVLIEVEGHPADLDSFTRSLRDDPPPAARVDALRWIEIAAVGGTGFTIGSSEGGDGRTLVSPDLGSCSECLGEMADPTDRRYRHPFISCTNCGPRFTIIQGLPYDRPATTMAPLSLCRSCRSEYDDPDDRRFHAQTIACLDCGPRVRLRDACGETSDDAAVHGARRLLAEGRIIAVKGIGGFHLVCDAGTAAAVSELRRRKGRGDKPFAVMVADVPTARGLVHLSDGEERLLTDLRRPVVLLRKKDDPAVEVAPEVAPDSPDLGVVLAYTPLHRLLFGLHGDEPGPATLVMTSGNIAGESIVFRDEDAFARLAHLADAWLYHDRAIEVPCDDSVVRVAAGEPLPVRRSRGWAPLPIALPLPVGPSLAVGGDAKNTFCLAEGHYAWLSAHIGDLDHLATVRSLESATEHLATLTGVRPRTLVTDRHPDYRSVGWARRRAEGRDVRSVQHHHAHIASAMAENGHDGAAAVIGFAFDGTGFGDDDTIWGGEVLLADYDGFERAGHLGIVPLPGGDGAVRNPCRMALSHLRAAGVPWNPALPCVAACSRQELAVVGRQLDRGLGCVPTSSMGRLFDAVSSIAGVCHRADYEAEAAMRFEGIARAAFDGTDAEGYAFGLHQVDGRLVADPGPVVAAVAADVLRGAAPALVAVRFHLAVADLVAELAVRLRDRTGLGTVALSGGVFLNALLTELCVDRLERGRFRVLRHRLVPPSDAGLALGQIIVAARIHRSSS